MSVDIGEDLHVAFRAEATELLAELDDSLLALETSPRDGDFVHRVFQAIHTMKASRATAGYGRLSVLANRLEEIFHHACSGRLAITVELLDCSLRACDLMSAILNADDPEAPGPDEQAIIDWFSALLPKPATESTMKDTAVSLHEHRPSTAGMPDSFELFLAECQEHLDTVESHALQIEASNSFRESLDALFRAMHSIKGNTGLLLAQFPVGALKEDHPLPMLASVAHAVESMLDSLREAAVRTIDLETLALVLEARDTMQVLLNNSSDSASRFAYPAKLLDQLKRGAGGTSANSRPDHGVSAFENTAKQCLQVFDNCLEQMESGQASRSILKAYQRGLKTLRSAAAHQKRDDLEEPLSGQLTILEGLIRSEYPVGRDHVNQLRDYLRATRLGIDSSSINQLDVPKKISITTPTANQAQTAKVSTTIRIDQEKLDRLMRVVGELLVAKGTFPILAERLAAGEDRATVTKALKDAGARISHIAEELQASIMAIRMIPVRTVFQRFPRMVHDLARSLSKEVELIIDGETTEMDKTLVEQIGEPLVHLVRNAVDHGLERPEERSRSGKASTGRLTLRASNDAGSVLIEVQDDGRGLDAEALKQKAVERGLITREAALAMSDAEAHRLVFLPGLSTVERVTDVSGRGVGMDVVKNNIERMQGMVSIRSTPGWGTVFSIKLPTSLIISKGILVEAGKQEYILPLGSIRDMAKIPAAQVREYRGLRMAQVRGEVYSVFSLAEMFGLPVEPADELSIAVIECGGVRYCLIAERFVSEVEVLVKALSGGLSHCKEFHGAAIMSDGRVVLVLNPLECHRLRTAAANGIAAA